MDLHYKDKRIKPPRQKNTRKEIEKDARPTPLLLSKPLGASSPIILIALFTSETALVRHSGPFTS